MTLMCFMQQAFKGTEVWHLMCSLPLLWFDITRTNTHSKRRGETHPYKYILIPPVICSQQLSVLHSMNNSLISKVFSLNAFFFSMSGHAHKKTVASTYRKLWKLSVRKKSTSSQTSLRTFYIASSNYLR